MVVVHGLAREQHRLCTVEDHVVATGGLEHRRDAWRSTASGDVAERQGVVPAEMTKPSPNPLTERRFQPKPCNLCGRNSVVECHLAKVNVEGSSPFARSKALVIPGLFFVRRANMR